MEDFRVRQIFYPLSQPERTLIENQLIPLGAKDQVKFMVSEGRGTKSFVCIPLTTTATTTVNQCISTSLPHLLTGEFLNFRVLEGVEESQQASQSNVQPTAGGEFQLTSEAEAQQDTGATVAPTRRSTRNTHPPKRFRASIPTTSALTLSVDTSISSPASLSNDGSEYMNDSEDTQVSGQDADRSDSEHDSDSIISDPEDKDHTQNYCANKASGKRQYPYRLHKTYLSQQMFYKSRFTSYHPPFRVRIPLDWTVYRVKEEHHGPALRANVEDGLTNAVLVNTIPPLLTQFQITAQAREQDLQDILAELEVLLDGKCHQYPPIPQSNPLTARTIYAITNAIGLLDPTNPLSYDYASNLARKTCQLLKIAPMRACDFFERLPCLFFTNTFENPLYLPPQGPSHPHRFVRWDAYCTNQRDHF